MITRTYSQARAELASLMDSATQDREVVVIERRGAEPVAMIAMSELEGLTETAHLLRSPANAQRLLTALKRATADKGKRLTPEALRRSIGINSVGTK